MAEKEPMPNHRSADGSSNASKEESAQSSSQLESGDKAAVEKPKHVTGIKLIFILTSLALVMFLSLLDISIVATAIPRITTEFNSLADIGWYGSVFLLGNFTLQPLTGKIYTHFSYKYAFLAFLAIFEIGSLLCGVAVSSNMLIVGRAVAGLGSSGLSNGAIIVLASCIPIHKMAAYLGTLLSIGQIGVVAGPLLGGVLTEYTTWRWCFYINLPIGGIAAILLLFVDMPKRGTITAKESIFQRLLKLDLIGFALFAPAAVQLLFAFDWGGTRYAWNSATVIGLLCGAVVTIALFCWWQYYKKDGAMIPFSVIGQRIVWCSCLLGGFFMGTMLLVSFYLPLYFQAVKGASPTLSGVYLLPQVISQIICSTISGMLVKKYGYYLPWSVAASVMITVSAGLISTFTPNTSTGVWIGYQILAGAGRGFGLQMPIIAVQNAVSLEHQSVAFSMVMATQTLGGSVFLAIGKAVFANGLEAMLAKYAPGVDPVAVINAGAGAVRQAVSAQQLPGVLLAYSKAISQVFYAATGGACMTFLLSWGIGWNSVKKKKSDA